MAYTHPDILTYARRKVPFVEWLQHERLLERNPRCSHCAGRMVPQQWRLFRADGVCFRCQRCQRRRSVRNGSRFDKSGHVSVQQQMHLMVSFSAHSTALNTARHWRLNRHTVERYFAHFRSMIEDEMIRRSGGGELEFYGGAVEVDVMHVQDVRDEEHETEIGDYMILGLFEPDSGILRTRIIDDEKTRTIEPIIQELVPHQCLIFTDSHAAFRNLNDLGYEHYSVNHTADDWSHDDIDANGDPITVTTNHLESLWGDLRPRVEPYYARTVARIGSELHRLAFDTMGSKLLHLYRV